MVTPLGMHPLSLGCNLTLGPTLHWESQFRNAVRDYHIFNSFRPWWISQQYLPPEQRPVNLPQTVSLFLILVGLGLGLVVTGRSLEVPQA